jgi:hypothetical protein
MSGCFRRCAGVTPRSRCGLLYSVMDQLLARSRCHYVRGSRRRPAPLTSEIDVASRRGMIVNRVVVSALFGLSAAAEPAVVRPLVGVQGTSASRCCATKSPSCVERSRGLLRLFFTPQHLRRVTACYYAPSPTHTRKGSVDCGRCGEVVGESGDEGAACGEPDLLAGEGLICMYAIGGTFPIWVIDG